MSKLGCICGHVIRDQTDRLPYKAGFLRDFDREMVFDAIERECESLVAAVVVGDREAWLQRHYGGIYPRDLPNGAVFHDFVLCLLTEYMGTAYECEACGRLWVQRPGTDNEFAAFVPESGRAEHVLRSSRDERPSTQETPPVGGTPAE